MLTGLKIQGFKAYSDATIPLQPLTVLIGRNGSGKSTILHALDLLGGLSRGTVKEYLASQNWEYGDLPHLLSDKQGFAMGAALEGEHGRLSWEIGLETRRRPGIRHEEVRGATSVFMTREGRLMSRRASDGRSEAIAQTLTSSWLATLDLDGDTEDYPELVEVARWARGIHGYLFLDPLGLRRPSQGGDDIGRSGDQLAGFLGKLQKRGKLDSVFARVKKHYPRMIELDVKRGKYGWTSLYVTEKWGRSKATFNARQVSDGLLRLLAVAAIHELEEPPSVILLDEIENGLHPELLGSFVEMLQSLVDDSGGRTQVVVTTHSPIALNFVRSPEQVLLVYRQPNGSAAVKPMSDLRDFAKLRAHFDLGELWYNVGDERLLREDS